MVVVFTEYTTPRLVYVLDFIFKSKGTDYHITTSIEEFKKIDSIKINYSNVKLHADFQIFPQGIIQESQIKNNYELTFLNDKWTINQQNDDFAVIFYFLSRYEEYVIKQRDKHDRFSAQDSFIFKNNRLHKPNVDIIVKSIWAILKLDYSIVKHQFKTIITFDIDSAWAIKNKGFFRSLLSDIKDLTKGRCIRDKFMVRLNKINDPFDTFSIIKNTAKTNKVICFFLMANWGKYDKNIHWKNKSFQSLIKNLSESCEIGIHPSYQSYLKPKIIQKEIKRLSDILNYKVFNSRQHFLKLTLPQTYQQLVELGITDDYTMGFADGYGFRAGTSFSFPFFDLSKNEITSLRLHPITYMDGTLNEYLKLNISEAIKVVYQLKKEVQNVGGLFIPLWHNETLNNKGKWQGWLSVFEANLHA